jgi:hypothetical protein
LWKDGSIEQELIVNAYQADNEIRPGFVLQGTDDDFMIPSFAVWRELAKFNFLDIRRDKYVCVGDSSASRTH